MTEKKLLFIVNPKAGKAQIKNHLLGITDIFIKAGYRVETHITQSKGDASSLVAELDEDYDLLVLSGGDGTLDEVVNGMMKNGRKYPLGYIPAGSTNDFARSLGIPSDMIKAAHIAVGDNVFSCDIGQFNDDTFIYIAGFGLFTEISYETPQGLKNLFGHAAYILSAVKSLAMIPNYLIQVEANGELIQDRFIYGMITNSVSVGGFKGITGKDVRLDDGDFEVMLIKVPNDFFQLNEIIGVLTGIVAESDMIYNFKASHIRIRSRECVPWTLDGENGGEHWSVDIKNHHKKINILI